MHRYRGTGFPIILRSPGKPKTNDKKSSVTRFRWSGNGSLSNKGEPASQQGLQSYCDRPGYTTFPLGDTVYNEVCCFLRDEAEPCSKRTVQGEIIPITI